MTRSLPITAPEADDPPTAPVESRARRRARRVTARPVAGMLFVLPFFLVVVAFLVVPLGYAFWLSLSSKSLALGTRFSGLDNYVRAFTDPVLLDGLLRVVLFGLVQIPIMLGIALAGALVLDAVTTKFAMAFRLIAFMPYAVPAVVGALMWGFLYSRTFGPFADLPTLVGGDPIDFFNAASSTGVERVGAMLVAFVEAQLEADLGERVVARLRYSKFEWQDSYGVGNTLATVVSPHTTSARRTASPKLARSASALPCQRRCSTRASLAAVRCWSWSPAGWPRAWRCPTSRWSASACRRATVAEGCSSRMSSSSGKMSRPAS